ncbi:MAG TPA: cytidine deaminase [Myxococcaceae bacterium]|nr:cytidine deaminase [Myxococcaceae bacterium]
MDDNAIDWEALAEAAAGARGHAHAPYSRFAVGAAALFSDGAIAAGANVENASSGLTVCAERHAVAAGVLGGHGRLRAVLVVADADPPVPPCGACRQVLAEFADARLPVQSRSLGGARITRTLGELLPEPFGPGFLERA